MFFWNDYNPPIIQNVQEADPGVLVPRKKDQTGVTSLQPLALCHM